MQTDIFAEAAKRKLRFSTVRGSIATEDLYDLPLTSTTGKVDNLNNLAQSIHAEVVKNQAPDFVTGVKKTSKLVELQLEIVKAVIGDKLAAKEKAEKAAQRKEKTQRLMEIIASKEDEALKGKSIKDLKKELAALDDDETEE